MHLSQSDDIATSTISSETGSGLSPSQLEAAIGWKPDGLRDDCWVGVTSMVHNARDLRAVLLNMAYAAHADKGRRVLYVLLGSRMTAKRIDKEVEQFRALVKPQIGDALQVLACDDSGAVASLSGLPDLGFRAWLEFLVIRHASSPRKSSSRDVVFGLIFLLLLGDVRTVSAAEIGAWSGASHPTVSSVLSEFLEQSAVAREHGRVALRQFPLTLWSRWVARSLDARKQVRFVGSSTDCVDMSTILVRLRELKRSDVAIGGMLAAVRYHSGHDLSSSAEHLELTMHGTPKVDLSFINVLDPSLSQNVSATLAPRITVNFLQRPKSFFRMDNSSVTWVDPITCLLDLHAAGRSEEADGLLQNLLSDVGNQRAMF